MALSWSRPPAGNVLTMTPFRRSAGTRSGGHCARLYAVHVTVQPTEVGSAATIVAPEPSPGPALLNQ